MRTFIDWIATRPVQTGLAVLLAIATAFLVHVFTLQPRTDRPWQEYLSRTAHVQRTSEGFSVAPVSDWSYSPISPVDKNYGRFEANFADLENVWFMVEPSPASDWIAHTLLLFEFKGGRIVGLTIEARMEENETYSPFSGLWNKYELAYMWATAHDLLTRRAVLLDHKVFVYPLKLTVEQKQNLLHKLLETTAQLETKPRFYNTLFHNCTNELAKRAGLSWNYAFVLTGKSPGLLFRKGVIPGPSFSAAEARADLTAWLKAQDGKEKSIFDASLLTELRARGTE